MRQVASPTLLPRRLPAALLPAALLPAALLAAAPAAAEGFACRFESGDGGARIEARLALSGETWRLSMLGESLAARPVDLDGAGARHFVVAPVDTMAKAAALLSIFEDGSALLTIHGDFLGPAAVTRTGTCMREGD
jgi:hypothetical protein